MSIEYGQFPNALKAAKIVPIFKKGDRKDVVNYRPISVLPFFSKILEKLVFERLYDFLNYNNILILQQFGFRKKYSTYMPIFHMYDRIMQEIDKGNFTVGIFSESLKGI